MNIPLKNTGKKTEIFLYLLFLTGMFLLLEINFFIQTNKNYFVDFISVSDFPHIPISVLPGILYDLLVQLTIHLLFCIFIWCLTLFSINSFSYFFDKYVTVGITIWVLATLSILTGNQLYFPNSQFSVLTNMILISQFTKP